jgi:hypothetical protein
MDVGDRRQVLEDELGRIDAERDDTLFRLRLERRERVGEADEAPSPLRLRYEELEARRKEVKAELRGLGGG